MEPHQGPETLAGPQAQQRPEAMEAKNFWAFPMVLRSFSSLLGVILNPHFRVIAAADVGHMLAGRVGSGFGLNVC